MNPGTKENSKLSDMVIQNKFDFTIIIVLQY